VKARLPALLGMVLAFEVACENRAPKEGTDLPRNTAPQAGQVAAPETHTTARRQPELDTSLIERVFDLATRFGPGLTTEGIEASLDVQLAGAGVVSGSSRRWPMVVTFVPATTDDDVTLAIAFSDITTLTLADIEARFGRPISQIQAKESLSSFNTPSGARLRVKTLDGTSPKAHVGSIRLDLVPKKEPHLPELFDEPG